MPSWACLGTADNNNSLKKYAISALDVFEPRFAKNIDQTVE